MWYTTIGIKPGLVVNTVTFVDVSAVVVVAWPVKYKTYTSCNTCIKKTRNVMHDSKFAAVLSAALGAKSNKRDVESFHIKCL